ncbi:putative phage abortive infection protein [Qipengyuania sp.]|uniref:putative phage abortive infection protein n=1 Tax=Qipengyuania sp. TaxID=2004515 RepID=UPI003AF4DFB4
MASGLGWNPLNTSWNFTNTGAFGDSFGPLSAGMASVAALSAIATYRAQSTELERTKKRDRETDKQNARLAFERTFFQLLDHHRQNVSNIDLDGSGPQRTGQDAFRSMVYYLRNHTATGMRSAWGKTFSKYQNDLGHYFRFLYHFVRFIDRSGVQDAYFYIQILRATLSESELILLGANCAYGEGAEKFRDLVERYSLLHNLSSKAIDEFEIRGAFAETAFQRH